MTDGIIRKWAVEFLHGLFPWRTMLANELYGAGYIKAVYGKEADDRKKYKDAVEEGCEDAEFCAYKGTAWACNEQCASGSMAIGHTGGEGCITCS